MQDNTISLAGKIALVTGGALRIGASIVRTLHAEGMSIALHYRRSRDAAVELARALNAERAGSVELFQADIMDIAGIPVFVESVVSRWGRLDTLVNNASTFYPTPLGAVIEAHWDDLIGTNLKGPFFLAQAAAPHLAAHAGSIVNIADIHGVRPLKAYPVYSAAKAGLIMLTKSLAKDLGPEVRANAVLPGPILWPTDELTDETKRDILARTVLGRAGEPSDIARAVLYLTRDAGFVTGQTLAVDGGRMLHQ